MRQSYELHPEGGPCHARAGLPASKGLQRKLLGGGGAHY